MKTTSILLRMTLGAALMAGVSYSASSEPAPVRPPSAPQGHVNTDRLDRKPADAPRSERGLREKPGNGAGISNGPDHGLQRVGTLPRGNDADAQMRVPPKPGNRPGGEPAPGFIINKLASTRSQPARAMPGATYPVPSPNALPHRGSNVATVGGVARSNVGSTAAINGADMTHKR